MKLTKFIVLDKYKYMVAPMAFVFSSLSEKAFKKGMQNAIRYYQNLKQDCQEQDIEYIPETFTLYKLTKVKEFKL